MKKTNEKDITTIKLPIADFKISIDDFISNLKPYKPISLELPTKYIINENAAILFWGDETKTIVKKCEDDTFDKRLAFLTAYFQRHSGLSKTKANKFLKELIIEGKNNGTN